MGKFFSSIITFVLGGLLLLFMVANRTPVRLGLDPFNAENPAVALPFTMPLWAALFATLFLGYFLGAFGMWLSGSKTRQKLSSQKKELKQLKQELSAALQTQKDQAESEKITPALRQDEDGNSS